MSNNTRREFEWSLDVADGVASGYGRVEVKVVIDPSDYNSRAGKFGHDALLNAADFLNGLTKELDHMAKGMLRDAGEGA